MGSIRNSVHYCSVSKGNRTLYVYSGGDPEVENLAGLCLDRTPAYHKWYFEIIGKRTFGFLMEDGLVFFTIVDKDLGKTIVLRFLEHLRDEFKKVAKKGSKGSFSSMNTINVQEQLMPVIRRLIHSLEHVSRSGSEWKAEASSSAITGLSPSTRDGNGQTEAAASTKIPLLGKSNKQDRKKSKDHHAISMREIDLEEHRRSQDRGVKLDPTTLGPDNQGGAASLISLQKDMGSMRVRSSSQAIRKKWWRQVRIVLAIDVAICLLLFIIWLFICGGFGCTR